MMMTVGNGIRIVVGGTGMTRGWLIDVSDPRVAGDRYIVVGASTTVGGCIRIVVGGIGTGM
jgi:hypothetical protein